MALCSPNALQSWIHATKLQKRPCQGYFRKWSSQDHNDSRVRLRFRKGIHISNLQQKQWRAFEDIVDIMSLAIDRTVANILTHVFPLPL